MDDRTTWRAGHAEHREALGPLVRALVLGESHEALEILREKAGRRRIARGRLATGAGCFLKHYPPGQSHHRVRDALKQWIDLTPAAREFAALRRLHAAGIGVPEPLAYYRFPNGERVLVTRLLEGEPLRRAIDRPPTERRHLLEAVGRLVARLHAAGFVHRDLHRGNVWVTPDGPVLLDCPAVLPLRLRWLRRQDLGKLDASLARWLSLADRVRLRAAALAVVRPFSPDARRKIRALGDASDERRRTHLRSRTRRALRPGRLYARLLSAAGRGMRLRTVDEAILRTAIDGREDAGASLGVMRFPGRALPTWGPGSSPARRMWLAGQGLRARGIGAPPVLAFVEERRLGRVARSAVVLEARDTANPAALGGPAPWLGAIVTLGAALRASGVAHERLSEAALCCAGEGELGLTELDAVRFPRRLGARERERIDEFVARQIEASGASAFEQEKAIARYAARTVFLPGGRTRITRPRS